MAGPRLLQPSLRVPRRLAETPRLSAPAVVLDHSPHLRVHAFGEWATVVLPLPLGLDFNEDAVDVLPEAPAVDPLLNIPDPVLLLLGVVVMLDREDDVGVLLLAALHLAEKGWLKRALRRASRLGSCCSRSCWP